MPMEKEEHRHRYFVTPDPALSRLAVETWAPMVKKTSSVVYMRQIDVPFTVDTNEGPLCGKAGGYVAHDPLSGHFWPVEQSYVEAHYERAKP